MPTNFYFSDSFDFPLPEKHRFPGMKYGMLRSGLLNENIITPEQLVESPLCSTEQVTLAHDSDFVYRFEAGELDVSEVRRIGSPWSEFFVRRCRATVGGAIASARTALEYGISGQLAGGTHHAHRSFGSGYCVYNDQAIVALYALQKGWANKVAIIDLDVHQGDGTASILKDNPNTFVLSLHGKKNFPFRKQQSDLDIELADGTDDDQYMLELEKALPAVWGFGPDLVLYQAGVDVLAVDKLGRLSLSLEGLARRDQLMLSECHRRSLPVSMAIGGGYADPIEQTVEGYLTTYRVAKRVFQF